MTRTVSTSILQLQEGDVVIPQTAEPQEWIVAEVVETGLRRNPFKIVWLGREATYHSARATFAVKAGNTRSGGWISGSCTNE